MSLLGKLPTPNKMLHKTGNTWPSSESIDRLLGWLVSRQTSILQEEGCPAVSATPEPQSVIAVEGTHASSTEGEVDQGATREDIGIEPSEDELRTAGFAGRCNKAADTCYAFWAGGSLMVRYLRIPTG